MKAIVPSLCYVVFCAPLTELDLLLVVVGTVESLWHQLTRMGLGENDENHPVFGNAKQALEALVQQRLELSTPRIVHFNDF